MTRRPPRRAVCTCGLAFATLLVACGSALAGTFVRPDLAAGRVPEPPPEAVDTRLLLVGDAGMPRLDTPEPVFVALAAEAAQLPDRTWVVFLGDNVYPSGLPPAGDATRALAERRLRAQIDAVTPTGAQLVFVPGNHDWYFDGWAGVRRQAEFVAALDNPRVRVLPAGACPGPDVVDAGTRVRLVFLDSQWWLADGDKPHDPTSACAQDSEREIVAATRHAIGDAGDRRVVVLAHHPIASHGEHGGHFGLRQHVFPLVDAAPWAWVPLPIVGSLYPLARQSGIAAQDFANAKYQRWIAAVRGSLSGQGPVLVACGHEHTLQVLDLAALGTQLVSGAGTEERPNDVGRGDDTLLASSSAGFARVDVLRDGRARLEILTVSASGAVARPLAVWLPNATP